MAIRWDKFTVKSQQAMQQAQSRATELGNAEIQPVHLLLALVEDREGVIPAVCRLSVSPTIYSKARKNCRAWPGRRISRG